MRLALLFLLSTLPSLCADLRVGLIGLDTSHATAFTALLNDPQHPQHVPGARVVAGVQQSSPDIPSSHERVEGYTEELRTRWKVEIVPTIEALCARVDAVMVVSVDGRPHLAQAEPVLRAGKPCFIDKPLAGSLADAVKIVRLARETGTPCFTASAYRFYDSMRELLAADVGEVRGAVSYGPGPKEEHHPDFFWYGIHPTEALFTVLGPGCETVTRTAADDVDVVTGLWSGGRSGVLLALRTRATPHQVTVFGATGVAQQKAGSDSYAPLVREIIAFFQSGRPPVPLEDTLRMFAFMEAADESRRRGGIPISLQEVLEKNGWTP